MTTAQGDVQIALAGQTWRLKLGTGALIDLQELVSKIDGALVPLDRIFLDAARGRVLAIRAILWAGLRRYHAEVTLSGVDDLLDAATPQEIQTLLSDLGATTVPDPADVQALGVGEGRPPAAQASLVAGTGEVFTLPLGASA